MTASSPASNAQPDAPSSPASADRSLPTTPPEEKPGDDANRAPTRGAPTPYRSRSMGDPHGRPSLTQVGLMRRLALGPGHDLGRIDETQRYQQPHQRGRHVDHRHRVDRLPGADAGGI